MIVFNFRMTPVYLVCGALENVNVVSTILANLKLITAKVLQDSTLFVQFCSRIAALKRGAVVKE